MPPGCVGGGVCWVRLAFWAMEGGSDGPTEAVATFGVPGAAGAAGGDRVVVWPCRFVIVTMLVVLLITTVLWMLLKMTLLGGGGAT